MGKATQALIREHDHIQHILNLLTVMLHEIDAGSVPEETAFHHLTNMADYLQLYADTIHHGKEERMLFTRLEQRGIPREGGPVGVMLSEHDAGRSLIAQMKDSARARDYASYRQAARLYIQLLEEHIYKENNILFHMADQVISDNEQAEIAAHFPAHDAALLADGAGDHLAEMLAAWEQAFPGVS